MEFSTENQKRLAIDDELGRRATLFEVRQACLCVMGLADGLACKGD